MKQEQRDPIEWHNSIARRFDEGYGRSQGFKERKESFSRLIWETEGVAGNAADIGCGPGIISSVLAEKFQHVTAVDASIAMLELCERRFQERGQRNVELVHADASSFLAKRKSEYDLVVCSSVFEYIADWRQLLCLIRDSLQTRGQAMISIPNWQSLYRHGESWSFRLTSRPRYLSTLANRVGPAQLANEARSAGMEIMRPYTFVAGVGASWLPRRLARSPWWATLAILQLRKA